MDSSESDSEFDDNYSYADDNSFTETESADESDFEIFSNDCNAENDEYEVVEQLVEENLSSNIEEEIIWSTYEGRHLSFNFSGIC